MASVRDDMGPPLGAWRRISSSSSAMAFSATGFLLMFFIRPISKDMPRRLSVGSSRKAINPGAGSTLTMAGRPSKECNYLHKRPRASRSVIPFSSWIMDVTVYEVVVSQRTMIFWLHLLSISAVNETPMTLGGSSVVCWTA